MNPMFTVQEEFKAALHEFNSLYPETERKAKEKAFEHNGKKLGPKENETLRILRGELSALNTTIEQTARSISARRALVEKEKLSEEEIDALADDERVFDKQKEQAFLVSCKIHYLFSLGYLPDPKEIYYRNKLTGLAAMIQAEQEKKDVFSERELKALERELDQQYSEKYSNQKISQLTSEELVALIKEDSDAPRFKQLLIKFRMLKIHQENARKARGEVIPEPKVEHEVERTPAQKKLDIWKKFVDIVDDLWASAKQKFPEGLGELLGPILVGAAGLFIHLYEGYLAAKDLIPLLEQWREREKNPSENASELAKKTLREAFRFMLAGAGVGLAATLIASAAGAAVAGMTVPLSFVLIPAFLTAIYSLVLWKKVDVLTKAKEDESTAAKKYESFSTENKDKLKKLKDEIIHLQEVVKTDLDKMDELLEKQEEYAKIQGELDGKKEHYLTCREERLKAEREVAFSAVEVAMSTFVLVGTTLGASLLLGAATVASFGGVPLALILIGVIGGALSKYFEHLDEKNGFSFTRKMREWFTSDKTLDFEEGMHDKDSLLPSHAYSPEKESTHNEESEPLLKNKESNDDTPEPEASETNANKKDKENDLTESEREDGGEQPPQVSK